MKVQLCYYDFNDGKYVNKILSDFHHLSKSLLEFCIYHRKFDYITFTILDK